MRLQYLTVLPVLGLMGTEGRATVRSEYETALYQYIPAAAEDSSPAAGLQQAVESFSGHQVPSISTS